MRRHRSIARGSSHVTHRRGRGEENNSQGEGRTNGRGEEKKTSRVLTPPPPGLRYVAPVVVAF